MNGLPQQEIQEQREHARVVGERGLSPVVQEILHVMRDPAASVARLSAIVSSDQRLSESVLRIANSPLLALPQRVSSVSKAITMLGFNALRDSVMRMVVTGAFRSLVDLFTAYSEFWNHSVSCGILARMLVRRHRSGSEDDAFVAGLFHDLGMIVLQGRKDGVWPGVESGVEGGSHEAIGAWLAEHWGLSVRIQEAICLHHKPSAATVDPRLTATVHVADVLCRRLEVGRYAADPDTGFDPGALRLLGLQEENLTVERLTEDVSLIKAGMAEAPGFAGIVASVKNSLVDSIGGLPYQERLTLALCYQEGLSFEEVASLVGNSASEVNYLHDRALDALSAIVRDYV
jgi:HD-like signal output (HDOD) protein